MALTWGDLLARAHEMSPQQLQQPVTIYNANNDEVLIADGGAIRGEEGEDELAPIDQVPEDTPYIIVGLN